MTLRVLDAARLSRVTMTAIVDHWSGGGHRANALDLSAYNLLTEGDGAIRYGVDIALNSAPLKAGYAAHTAGANTGRIGHAMCGMLGAREVPWHPGSQPLTRVQWDRHVLVNADLCEFYAIGVARNRLLFHAEVQPTLGIIQNGKWDVAVLPFDPDIRGAHAIGDRMRDEVLSALRGNGPSIPLPQPEPMPAAVEGATGRVTAASLNFRRGPGIGHESTGSLPAGVVITVLALEGDWLRVRTPAGHEGWVHGGYVQMIDVARLAEPTKPDPLRAELTALQGDLDRIADDLPDDRAALLDAIRAARLALAGF